MGQNASAEAIAAKNAELGYNDPFFVRYFKYILNLCKGDLGVSWTNNKPVFDLVMARFPVTIILAAGATLIGVVFGVLLGVLAAVKQYSGWDIAGTSLAMILASFPAFWIGMLFIILFSLKLGWLPSFGASSLKHFILPTLTVSLTSAAGLLRLTRSAMLETIRQEYIRTAKAKGASSKRVIWKHALRNALLPVVTALGTGFGASLGGAIIAETVFAMPGMGTLMTTAIRQKDIPMVMGATLFLAVLFSFVILLVDILYAFIDPRIKAKYQNGGKHHE